MRLLLSLLLFLSLFFTLSFSKEVTLQLQWKHQFQFAGYYIAKEKGFYKESGLDVNIKEFIYGVNQVDEVLEKRADFAIGRTSVIMERLKGKDIVALAAVFQRTPMVLLANKASGIKKLEDLIGKKVMVTDDAITSIPIRAMFLSQGVDLELLKRVPHSFNPIDLTNGTTDAMASYISNEPFILKELGVESVIFNPKDYGFEFYGDILFTSEKLTQTDPKLVDAFLLATLRGWNYAFKNIEESAEIIFNKYNTQNKSLKSLIYEGETLKELALIEGVSFGNIDEQKLTRMADIYHVLGLKTESNSFENFIYKESINTSLDFTKKELAYLKKRSAVRLCSNPDWNPIEFINKTGKPEGITIDLLKAINEELGNKLNFIHIPTKNWAESQKFLESKVCDILPSATVTPRREGYANFTDPFISYDIVVVTDEDAPYVSSIDEILDRVMVRKKGSGVIDLVKRRYPDAQIKEVAAHIDAFKEVSLKESYATLSTLPVLSFYKKRYGFSNLKIAGYTDLELDLSIAVRDDDEILLSILNKALESIDGKKRSEIFDSWGSEEVEREELQLSKEDGIFIFGVVALITLIAFMTINVILKHEVKRKTRELSLAKLEAEKANRDKTLFLSKMSHEIKTPLNSILGFCEILGNSELNSVQNNYLKSISASGHSLLTILNDISDISKIESNEVEISKRNCNISEIANEIHLLFDLEAKRKGLSFKVVVDAEEGTVLFDDGKLKQIIINLVSNALKYTDDGEVILALSTYGVNSDKCHLVVSVKDSGIGMKDDSIDDIFDAFKHKEGYDKKYLGTGLGLTIVKSLTAVLGGSIEISSEEKKGSTFRIKFNDVEVVNAEGIEDKGNYFVSYNENIAVLVVEDDEASRTFLSEYLKLKNISVYESESGESGVEIAKIKRPDLIITDIKMSGIDGFELVRRLKIDENTRNIPVVALTASIIKNNFDRYSDSFEHFLEKPIDFGKLEAILEKHFKIESKESDCEESANLKVLTIDNERKEQLKELLKDVKEYGDFEKYSEILKLLSQCGLDKKVADKLQNRIDSFDIEKIENMLCALEGVVNDRKI